jgi:predicted Rossmann fold flavoprotein
METVDIAVIGGGPAGLRAAEVAASLGREVTVFDGKPSVGRKFLVAGKGGLNLTHEGSMEMFALNYSGERNWEDLLGDFSNHDLREWCHGLGQETFQASSGRVYPKALKGAPVLRAWLARLREMGVEIRPKHLWQDLLPGNTLRFADGAEVRAKAIVFALGGGSWPKTGSDGGWLEKFRELGIVCEPLVSSNCGWECDWPPEVLAAAEGLPIKNIHVRAGGKSIAGELLVTRYGLEGGAIYALGSELRKMAEPAIEIDFKPTFSAEQLSAKPIRSWKLGKPAATILQGSAEPARAAKAFRIALTRPRPLAEAISSAGGIRWDELDANLMLRKLPGVFACGEMIDWDAPTGGYLLQAAFATGTRAGRAAAGF